MSRVSKVTCPRVNPNEDRVRVVEWLVTKGDAVERGTVLCAVESSKTTVEIEAQCDGIVWPLCAPGSEVISGATLAFIGASLDTIEAITAVQDAGTAESAPERIPHATPRARAVIQAHGLDPAEIVASVSVTGTIKERDVERFLEKMGRSIPCCADRGARGNTIPPAYSNAYLEEGGRLSEHELAVLCNLEASQRDTVHATMYVEVAMDGVLAELDRFAQKRKVMVTMPHLLTKCIGDTIQSFPRFALTRQGDRLYRYKEVNVAILVNGPKDRLYAPVVRNVPERTLEDIAALCLALSRKVMRNRLTAEEMEGACFTVSHIPQEISGFAALLNRLQSGAIAFPKPRIVRGRGSDTTASSRTLTFTLTYDHGVLSGDYAAQFLTAVMARMMDFTSQ